jgi:hypothetical protein
VKLFQYLFFTFLMLGATQTYANQSKLTLIDNGTQIELSVESLRQAANTEFTLFSPFSQRDIQVKGILLEDLLQTHFSTVPKKIKLVAIDGYEVFLTGWQKDHWLIVTHEDGQPISIRQRGPLRIVERDYNNKNPKNLRDFNDWIWMLQQIEIVQ